MLFVCLFVCWYLFKVDSSTDMRSRLQEYLLMNFEQGRFSLGYCPHSFFHCFEALGLPKSAACQIRSEASKTALCSSYVLFFAEAWESQAVLYWTMLTSQSFRFFFFICFAISVSHRSHPETTRSVSKHTRNTPRFSNSPTVRRRPYRRRTQCVLQFFARFPQD